MTITMGDQVESDHVLLISQMFPGTYGPKLRRQRRKKSKGGEASGSGEAKKRKLSAQQVNLLEQNFGNEHKLESERKDRLASELGLDPRQVAVWFQNRRARWKNKKLEEEYSKLKSLYESTVLEKCHLETEVLKLKEQLSDAMKEIQRLSTSPSDGGVSSNSPISSSISDVGPPFLGEFGALEAAVGYDEDAALYAIPDENSYIQSMEWFSQYL
ncbi:hypothetical protein CDL15_Pgr013576 [Punica granatum]|uniref:Homeobox-leucine zipper protein n=1 Tax=Punica granatum TaxID=22663 RepID=A0A218W1G3_PUNGR|nr:hypothetical protein CDL15_Pgr013576 [Punica granatum]